MNVAGSLKTAVIQMAVTIGDIVANEANGIAMVKEAAQKGSQLIVLPELWNSGYDLGHLAQFAQPLAEHKTIQKLQGIAKEFGVTIVAGSVATKEGTDYYNTAVTIDNSGEIVGKYHKIHLFPLGLKEDQYFTPGEDFCLIDMPWGKMGIILCYDVRFPALCQNLVLQGASVLVIPAQFAAARIDHWRILNQARAIENQCFVLACNITGEDDSGYCGCSMIISPWGEMIAEGNSREQILYGELDFAQIEKVRRTIPVFQQRRMGIDQITK